jgi:transposase
VEAVMADLFWLPDEPWAVMAPFMPKDQPGPERKDDRQIISGILHVLTSGCRWHDCPAAYGPRTTVYNRFNRWSRRGFWTAMLVLLAKAGWSGEAAAIDSTYVRAHRFLRHFWRLKPPHRQACFPLRAEAAEGLTKAALRKRRGHFGRPISAASGPEWRQRCLQLLHDGMVLAGSAFEAAPAKNSQIVTCGYARGLYRAGAAVLPPAPTPGRAVPVPGTVAAPAAGERVLVPVVSSVAFCPSLFTEPGLFMLPVALPPPAGCWA